MQNWPKVPVSLKIPSQPWGEIRIGATDWTIEKDEHGLSHGFFGTTDHRERVIRLVPDMEHWQSRLSGMHEVFHALSLSLWPGEDEDELTEKQIVGLSTVFVSFIRDNPEFAKWLTEVQ